MMHLVLWVWILVATAGANNRLYQKRNNYLYDRSSHWPSSILPYYNKQPPTQRYSTLYRHQLSAPPVYRPVYKYQLDVNDDGYRYRTLSDTSDVFVYFQSKAVPGSRRTSYINQHKSYEGPSPFQNVNNYVPQGTYEDNQHNTYTQPDKDDQIEPYNNVQSQSSDDDKHDDNRFQYSGSHQAIPSDGYSNKLPQALSNSNQNYNPNYNPIYPRIHQSYAEFRPITEAPQLDVRTKENTTPSRSSYNPTGTSQSYYSSTSSQNYYPTTSPQNYYPTTSSQNYYSNKPSQNYYPTSQSYYPTTPLQNNYNGPPPQNYYPATPSQSYKPSTPSRNYYSITPSQNYYPTAPSQSYNPTTPSRNYYPNTPPRNYYPNTQSQNYYPTAPSQNYNPSKPSQNYYPNAPSQSYYSATPPQGYYPSTPSQSYYSAAPTRNYNPFSPSQNYYPTAPSQNYNPSKPLQNYKPTAQSYDPSKSSQNYYPTAPSQSYNPSTPLRNYNLPVTSQNYYPTAQTQSYKPYTPSQNYYPTAQSQSYKPYTPSQNYYPTGQTQSYKPYTPSQNYYPTAQTQSYKPYTTSQNYYPTTQSQSYKPYTPSQNYYPTSPSQNDYSNKLSQSYSYGNYQAKPNYPNSPRVTSPYANVDQYKSNVIPGTMVSFVSYPAYKPKESTSFRYGYSTASYPTTSPSYNGYAQDDYKSLNTPMRNYNGQTQNAKKTTPETYYENQTPSTTNYGDETYENKAPPTVGYNKDVTYKSKSPYTTSNAYDSYESNAPPTSSYGDGNYKSKAPPTNYKDDTYESITHPKNYKGDTYEYKTPPTTNYESKSPLTSNKGDTYESKTPATNYAYQTYESKSPATGYSDGGYENKSPTNNYGDEAYGSKTPSSASYADVIYETSTTPTQRYRNYVPTVSSIRYDSPTQESHPNREVKGSNHGNGEYGTFYLNKQDDNHSYGYNYGGPKSNVVVSVTSTLYKGNQESGDSYLRRRSVYPSDGMKSDGVPSTQGAPFVLLRDPSLPDDKGRHEYKLPELTNVDTKAISAFYANVNNDALFHSLYATNPDAHELVNPATKYLPLNVIGLPHKYRYDSPAGNFDGFRPKQYNGNVELPGPVIDVGVRKGSGHREDRQKFQRIYDNHPGTDRLVQPDHGGPLNVIGLPFKYRYQHPNGNVDGFRPSEVFTNRFLPGPVVDVILHKPNLPRVYKPLDHPSQFGYNYNQMAQRRNDIALPSYKQVSGQPEVRLPLARYSQGPVSYKRVIAVTKPEESPSKISYNHPMIKTYIEKTKTSLSDVISRPFIYSRPSITKHN